MARRKPEGGAPPGDEAGLDPQAGPARNSRRDKGDDLIEGIIAAAREGSPGGASLEDEVSAGELDRAKQAMLRLLSSRMRSRWELRVRLDRRYSSETIEAAMNDLERVGLVDDRKFARLFLESRLRRRPRSYKVLRQELRSRGVPAGAIEEAVEAQQRDTPEEELARRVLEPKLRILRGAPIEQARAKAGRYLAGKGFSRSIIEDLLQDI